MKERLKRKQLSTWIGLLTVIALFVIILVLHFLLSVLGSAIAFRYMDIVEYAIFIFIGIMIVRKWLTEYEYTLIDDEFFVDRYIGRRPRRLLAINLSAIEHIGNTLPEGFSGKQTRLSYKPRRKGVTYVVYKDGGTKKSAYFSPSEQLLKKLKQRASL